MKQNLRFGLVLACLACFGWLASLEFINFLYFFELHLVYISTKRKTDEHPMRALKEI